MGRRGRPTAQRPLDYPDRLSDRLKYRCTFAEPALSACHRTGILLQENSERYCKRLFYSPTRFRRISSRRALRHCAGYCESRRMVRTAVCQRTRNVVQFRRCSLYRPACSRLDLGSIRKLHRKGQDTHGYFIHLDNCLAGYPVLRSWPKQYRYRYSGYCRFGHLSCSERTG